MRSTFVLRANGCSGSVVSTRFVRRDNDTAVPVLERSCEIAAQVGAKVTMSDVLRHLGIAEHAAGRPG
jgi:hypothetical protein